MLLKRLPGAATLGLLASLAAHSVIFGDDHVVAGAAHWPLALALGLALSGCVWMLWHLAAGRAHSIADGTRLAAELQQHLPRVELIALLGLASYVGVELIETDGHAPAGMLVVFAAIVAVSAVLWFIARSITRLIAGIAVHFRLPLRSLRPTQRLLRRRRALWIRSLAQCLRLFSRPPPMVARCA